MNPPVAGVDHLLLLVNSLDTAATTMRRLGFTVSPRGHHSPHLGSANHTIMFQRDYLELWGVVTPTELNAVHRENLQRGEGMHVVALTALDIEGVVGALGAAGIRTDPPIRFSRPVELPQGSAEARFSVVRPDKSQLPTGFMFFCEHHTPDVVWVPEWMAHSNTARGIEAVVIAAEDPKKAASRYALLFPTGRPEPMPGGMKVRTGKAALEFLTPGAIEQTYGRAGVGDVRSPFYQVARLAVADLKAAALVLRSNGVRFSEEADKLLIPPSEAHGVLFEFIQER